MSRATSAYDILAEWSTFGAEAGRSRTQRKTANPRSPELMFAAPGYSLSVTEIVANVACRACDEKPYHRMVLTASSQHGVPAGLIHAVIQKESGYNPGATSHRQARGLMQITPDTARFIGLDRTHNLYDPQTNINAGTAYLKYLMQTHNTFDHLLAAYNAGPGNVRKYNGVPPFAETRRYIQDVKRYYFVTSRD
ncbi:lytic transglycosylase domain-containing protein [Noviherbaspirillum aerium]|uniref:lytic transglycosylase domain-containing protein n=1 Tax=Noviherbaspirillum aerium TaxID=2588497 RepID=UPI00178C3A45|nr:lytic transglycosylase domain-containing protein [Noviherbaspirillum aerium]